MFGNLLNQALTLIPKQQFIYRKFNSYQINEYGVKVSIYDTDIEFEGSVQAIDSKMYQELGLDFSKKYINIFSSLNIKNVSREQNSPDKIIWNNKEYLVESCTDWYVQDGWTNIIAVENTEEQEDNANS
ncbi:MAG: hypothetical protein IKB70_03415 [Bacilli bacterium]|nr:hypothetical protein [Bacilli bacterium]